MRQVIFALAATAAAVSLAFPASAAQVDFTGYLRTGAGSSSQNGKEVCFRMPGSIVWFRLGNECDTYAALSFGATLGQVDGTTFKTKFTTAYGTQQMANWEQTTPAFREAYVEAVDIGASTGWSALKGATLWAGKRFYKNPDIHMLDYTYWEPAAAPGFGIDGVKTPFGKFAYAYLRAGDFAGYGIDKTNTAYNPQIIDGGSRTATSHDLRLEEIKTNPGGKVTLGANIIINGNRGGSSTYLDQHWETLNINGVPTTVLVQERKTRSNKGKDGFGFTVTHRQTDFLGLGGFHDLGFQYAKNAAALKGFGIAALPVERDEWLLFNHWAIEPKNLPYTATVTAGYRHLDQAGTPVQKDFWLGARPAYHINNVWSLVSEVGYQQVNVAGQDARKLAKVTLGTQFSMGKSVWARPSIRFYATYAKWNDAAAAAGSVACTGRDCATAVDAFSDKRHGVGYGVQVETWF
ncbi:carbohydrate porin [uncultured Aquincola sp.]|uniref:maltoporin n=1 Tax=uncultured Aquincola sp. TaxID=886556 RepID=UPI0032B1FB85